MSEDSSRSAAGNSIIAALRRYVWTRENLYALILGIAFLLIFACATMGSQPTFIYQGF